MAPLLLAALVQAHSPPTPPVVPSASGFVRDEADVLSEATEARLNGLLAAHQRATSNQVVVLTVPSLGGDVVEAVALRRASELRIGRKDIDNGVLLLIAPNERKVRIEVGYGLEGALPDARCAQIIRSEILPRFKAGDMEGGVEQGARAILGAIEGAHAPSAGRQAGDPLRFPPPLGFEGQFMVGLFGGLVLAAIGHVLFGAGDGRLPWVRAGATLLPAGIVALHYPVALLGFALAALMYLKRDSEGSGDGYTYGSSGGSWSSSSDWSSSSSSDSSFSGGGGSFGGGGSSGSW